MGRRVNLNGAGVVAGVLFTLVGTALLLWRFQRDPPPVHITPPLEMATADWRLAVKSGAPPELEEWLGSQIAVVSCYEASGASSNRAYVVTADGVTSTIDDAFLFCFRTGAVRRAKFTDGRQWYCSNAGQCHPIVRDVQPTRGGGR